MKENGKSYTKAGTDVEEVKRQNASAGPGFNQVLQQLAKANNPSTNFEEISNELLANNKGNPSRKEQN